MRIRERLGNEVLAFALLRGLTLITGLAALLIAPLRPEHQLHLLPLLAAVVLYNAALLAVLARWADEARVVFLATMAADLVVVFVLVWFTGGGTSQFYLLFYPLVALNAYYFGTGIGIVGAALAAGLLAVAHWLADSPEPWSQVGARAMLLGLVGLPLGYVATRERAERARAEQLNREMTGAKLQLARAEQLAAVGRLSSQIAHEVRNPLGTINLNVDLLGDVLLELSGRAADEGRELLRGIRAEIHALADVTEEYLIASRLQRPRLEKESLNELVTDLVAFCRPLADRAGVRISSTLDATLPLLLFDRAMLRLAVRNLIKNGIEAVSKGGEVSVTTGRDGTNGIISIADNGPGISPDALDRLFEPFFTTKAAGTGLGLSIAREITRAHGGDMTVASRPGEGARFTIRIPIGEMPDAG
jgi:two-component system, NtrC family, sensor kinase